MADILRREIALRCSVAHAFSVFTGQVDLWWPRGHRRNAAGTLRLDARPGGQLVERAPDGSESTIAQVIAVDPPGHLALDWFPGSPTAPTRVEISFAEAAGGSLVTIVHQPLTAGAEQIWPQRVTLFIKGWDAVLPALKAFAEQNKGD